MPSFTHVFQQTRGRATRISPPPRCNDRPVMLEDHTRRIAHFGSGQIFVSVLSEVVAAKAVPKDVRRKPQPADSAIASSERCHVFCRNGATRPEGLRSGCNQAARFSEIATILL